MKLTASQLRRIISEEVESAIVGSNMSVAQLETSITALIPDAIIDEDTNGEVIIRTGLMMTGRGGLEPFRES